MTNLTAQIQTTHPWMRRLLGGAALLVFIAGVQLFVFTEQTERFFAWTIRNPLTAAFLGAAYWSSGVLELLAARETVWARARIAVPAVLLFTGLTLATSLVHIDQFHLGPEQPLEAQGLAWVWLAIYAVVPFVLLILLLVQVRQPAGDPPPQRPLPLWLRGLIAAQSAVLVATGAMLFVAPQVTLDIWPWTLTVLAARAIGAWLLGLGVAAAQVMLENDWSRVRPVAASCIAFGLFQGLALVRYPDPFRWMTGPGWFYLAFLASLLALGVYGLWSARRPDPV